MVSSISQHTKIHIKQEPISPPALKNNKRIFIKQEPISPINKRICIKQEPISPINHPSSIEYPSSYMPLPNAQTPIFEPNTTRTVLPPLPPLSALSSFFPASSPQNTQYPLPSYSQRPQSQYFTPILPTYSPISVNQYSLNPAFSSASLIFSGSLQRNETTSPYLIKDYFIKLLQSDADNTQPLLLPMNRAPNGQPFYISFKNHLNSSNFIPSNGFILYPKVGLYEGQIHNQVANGEGNFTFLNVKHSIASNWAKTHIGKYVNGVPHGYGSCIYTNNDRYKGHFAMGMRSDDKGVYTFANGDEFIGSFLMDELVDGGTFTKKDGKILAGYLSFLLEGNSKIERTESQLINGLEIGSIYYKDEKVVGGNLDYLIEITSQLQKMNMGLVKFEYEQT